MPETEKRYSFTQPCCESCWRGSNPNREPTRLIEREAEECCHCGRSTEDGIYVRVDPKTVPWPTREKD